MHQHLGLFPSAVPASTARATAGNAPVGPPGHRGHAHFWERAFSRRRFVRTAAGATALVVGNGLWLPALAGAAPKGDTDARPIPIHPISTLFGLPDLFVDFPWYGYEVSTVTDFNGKVAAAEIQGMGTGTDTQTGQTTRYYFDADMRIMDGVYIAEDGRTRRGTFGFI